MDWSPKTAEVELPQGTIRYREAGSGRPLVFLHGVLVNGDLWRKVAEPLSRDFRVIVPDWPLGSHELPLNADADVRLPGLAAIVADFLEALDLTDVVLIANDTGGAIAQRVSVERPERLGGLVLTPSDCFDRFFPPAFRFLPLVARIPGSGRLLALTLRPKWAWRLPLAFGLLSKRPIPEGVMHSYLDPLWRNAGTRRDLRRVLREVHPRWTREHTPRLREFTKPVLVAWAAEDRLFPPADGRRLAQAYADGRYEEIADCRTFIPEDRPEPLVELIAGFAREPRAAEAAVAT